MTKQEQLEKWKKVEDAIDALNDRAALRRSSRDLDKQIEEYERHESEQQEPKKIDHVARPRRDEIPL